MKTLFLTALLLVTATTFANDLKSQDMAKTGSECNSSDPATNKLCKEKHLRKGSKHHSQKAASEEKSKN